MFSTILTAHDPAEGGMVVGLLKANGFHPVDLRTAAHATFAGAETFYRVEVPEAETKAAVEFLRAHGYAAG
ncbi:MAG: hypothetical protein AAB339_06380 [Elusimicrobiota bacterium]